MKELNEVCWALAAQWELIVLGVMSAERHMLHSFPFQSSLSLFHFNSFPLKLIQFKEDEKSRLIAFSLNHNQFVFINERE